MRVLLVSQLLVLVLAVVSGDRDRYHPTRRNARNPAAFNPQENTAPFWEDEAKAGIEKRLTNLQNHKPAKNIIMFLGDGMSIPTMAAARTLKGQREGRTGEETQLFFESFPTVGLSKTYCLNQQIADSACTATAYLCGVKTNYGMTGLRGSVPRYNCSASTDPSTHLDSIAAWAIADGRDAGIVTTTRITHASPSGTYARVANRYWEDNQEIILDEQDPEICPDIAKQLVYTSPGNQLKVILGGGRRHFIPNTTRDEEGTRGRRTDNRNLIEEWQALKAERNQDHRYIWNREQMMELIDSPPEYLLGLFEGSHIPYHMLADANMEPTLAEMTELAIRSLSRNEKGFFLFVEGGRIDHGHHDNFIELALDETLEFDLAIQRAYEMLGDEDTLMAVTADHAHVMAFNGYTTRGSDILGPSDDIGDDGVPYMTLSYANGPGARTPVDNMRIDVTQENAYRANPQWMTHAEVILDSETHGGDDVAVLAIGPHHHMFTGLYEQSQIPHLMAYAACIGPGLHSPACSSAALNHPIALAIYLLSLIVLLRTLLR